MYLVGIDIGKLKHSFCLIKKETGEVIVEPKFFDNNKDGFDVLLSSIRNPIYMLMFIMDETMLPSVELTRFWHEAVK